MNRSGSILIFILEQMIWTCDAMKKSKELFCCMYYGFCNLEKSIRCSIGPESTQFYTYILCHWGFEKWGGGAVNSSIYLFSTFLLFMFCDVGYSTISGAEKRPPLSFSIYDPTAVNFIKPHRSIKPHQISWSVILQDEIGQTKGFKVYIF